MPGPKKVAILGGGVSALTSAFYLTSQPGWKDRYDITVYQQGWRLGGKGASGRNRDMGDRIEEHGLHIFFGFYENAFSLMRQAYNELGRHPDAPLATWDEAFKKHDLVVLEQWFGDAWHHWPLDFPGDGGVPGDGNVLPTPIEYIERMINFIINLLHGSTIGPQDTGSPVTALSEELLSHTPTLRKYVSQMRKIESDQTGPLASIRNKLAGWLEDVVSVVVPDVESIFAHMALELVRDLKASLSAVGGEVEEDIASVVWLMRRFREYVFGQIHHDVDLNVEIHRLFVLLDMSTTIMIGMFLDGLVFPKQDWYKIDDWTFHDWLVHHGARPDTAKSTPVRTLQDAVYASHRNVGAGTILYCAMRLLFTYKGAVLYKMQAGMGDVVFVPLYEVLRRRGVKFEYFHQVTNLELTAGGGGVERELSKIHIGIQATVKGGAAYAPLYDVMGLPCWPSEPFYDQLNEGAALQAGGVNLENWWTTWSYVGHKVLTKGVDFDLCVLGISVGVFPYICQELIDDPGNAPFKAMVENVATTQTKGLQMWFIPDLKRLGWYTSTALGIAYEDPYDTWADMSQLIVREDWPASDPVGCQIYNTSSMTDDEPLPPRSDHGYPFRQDQRVKDQSIEWYSKFVRHIFPNATQTNDPEMLNWWWLHDPKNRAGIDRFEAQFAVGVWNPSDRYVLSVAGSNKHRLRVDQSGYANVVLTGDYTLTAIAAGCVECAVESGMAASRHISGYPQRIVGEWLPLTGEVVDTPPLPAPAPTPFTSLALPDYIKRDGDLLAFQPYRAAGTTMFNFVMAADYDKLQALCDRYLNIGGGTTVYKPLAPIVAFVAATVANMGSLDPAIREGFVTEEDYGLWVPVVAGKTVGGVFFPDRVLWFMPYMFVNSGIAAEGGREIFGFNKAVSTLSGPSGPTDTAQFTVDTLVIETYGVNSEAVVEPLIDVFVDGHGPLGDLVETWGDIADIVASLSGELIDIVTGIDAAWIPTLQFWITLFDSVLTGTVPMVFLKQFPSITDGSKAAYQAITECTSRIDGGIKGGVMLGDFHAAFHSYDSHRIVENLGLHTTTDAQGREVAHVLFQFWVEMDFIVNDGIVVNRTT